ncbi:hypothetical protein [Terasakiella sp.]|uniref:hypothetical protein n=1 Tax=Terasakiella sp. TaxID=2034861 RepID=UPI003AA843E9
MSVKLIVTAEEKYTQLVMLEGARACDFLDFYAAHFRSNAGCENVRVLVDVRGRPAVMGLAEFRSVLDLMHKNRISTLDMHIVSDDNARPMLGDLVNVLCEESVAKIRTFFYREKEEAEHVLASV